MTSQLQVAPAAWVGSWAQSLAEVKERSGLPTLADLETSTLPLARHCREPLASLAGAQGSDFPTWSALAEKSFPKAQRIFSRSVNKKHFNTLLGMLDASGKARLRSCTGPLASGWLQATPLTQEERLEDEEYELTARALLGQDLAPADWRFCQHGRKTGPRSDEACGAALCAKAHHCYHCATGGGTKARSDALVKSLEVIHKQCGFNTDTEVHVAAWDRFKWHCSNVLCDAKGTLETFPQGACSQCGHGLQVHREAAMLDVEVRSPEVPRLYFDLTVSDSLPGSAARLELAADRDGEVAREAERQKHPRYPKRRAPWKIGPFALESCSRLGQQGHR